MYDNRNPMPNWIANLKFLFGMYNQTYTFYKMDTLEIMPTHSDHFNTYCKLNNTTSDNVERVYTAYRALSIENVTVTAKRDEASMFEVSFRLLPEDTSGTYGKIIDRTHTVAS